LKKSLKEPIKEESMEEELVEEPAEEEPVKEPRALTLKKRKRRCSSFPSFFSYQGYINDT